MLLPRRADWLTAIGTKTTRAPMKIARKLVKVMATATPRDRPRRWKLATTGFSIQASRKAIRNGGSWSRTRKRNQRTIAVPTSQRSVREVGSLPIGSSGGLDPGNAALFVEDGAQAPEGARLEPRDVHLGD